MKLLICRCLEKMLIVVLSILYYIIVFHLKQAQYFLFDEKNHLNVYVIDKWKLFKFTNKISIDNMEYDSKIVFVFRNVFSELLFFTYM